MAGNNNWLLVQQAWVVAVRLKKIGTPLAAPGFDIGNFLICFKRVKTYKLLGVLSGFDLPGNKGRFVKNMKGKNSVFGQSLD